MLNLEELLQPIPGDNPSGNDLRYAPVSAQIREARRVEDELEQGVWKHDIKKADYSLVIRLATDSAGQAGQGPASCRLAYRSGDTCGRLRGPAAGTRAGRQPVGAVLGHGLSRNRRGRRPRVARYAADVDCHAVGPRDPPDTADRSRRIHWFDYHSSKIRPLEEEAARDDTKRALRQEAIDNKQPTAEEFAEACGNTPVAFYET